MALSPPTIISALKAAAPEFNGPSFLSLSSAIGTSIYTWAITPSNILISGITSGTAGSGTVTGFLTVPPNPALAVSVFSGNGVVGPNGVALARALGVGIPTAFASAQYTGPSIGVSSGTDLSKITSVNVATLTPILLSNMQSFFSGSLGPSAPQIATAISSAVGILLSTGATTPGTGIVIPVTPVSGPASGTSPSSQIF